MQDLDALTTNETGGLDGQLGMSRQSTGSRPLRSAGVTRQAARGGVQDERIVRPHWP
jgi:hypothetical protein